MTDIRHNMIQRKKQHKYTIRKTNKSYQAIQSPSQLWMYDKSSKLQQKKYRKIQQTKVEQNIQHYNKQPIFVDKNTIVNKIISSSETKLHDNYPYIDK